MLYPSIDDLMKKVDSKYKLVTLAAKRARELRDKGNPYIKDPKSHKYVGVALEEIVSGYITYEEEKQSEK
ncbi:DNA-directed RNA polymerase subunit omega [Caldalkalibacillus thermarum TA2.A1]|uniref:DNA-directed RNA polymerase subunit omega n=1 Tax=Caldalkalibacillus thermarum (strain TA2.A1) TaxID=986075 RepID=F5L7V1_CALTT|nr:DNA-directed RNA polymerase subunit omega [Caldalkalibacillus thermarum]EGL82610.1 DNA-directed RNA polymerase subunit omega [Caldalkalibacillus thermarum TA2.A1]QZT32796.1 DNA-directed RNA polymerase subunit omega [Caldalkalibacillus thermarum TA2.A1]